jgi:VCBS repeat-containing protein
VQAAGNVITNAVVSSLATALFQSGSGTITNNKTGIYTDTVADSPTLLNGLIAGWHMTESGSVTRADATNQGNNLGVTGTVNSAAAPGQTGNVAVFNDVPATNYLSVAMSSDVFSPSVNGYTITGWVYPTDLSGFSVMAAKVSSSGGAEVYEDQTTIGSGSNTYELVGAKSTTPSLANYQANNTTALSINTWYFIAAGYDVATGKAWISVNNGTKALAASSVTTLLNPPTTSAFVVGADATGGVGATMYVGHVYVWNRELTTTELTTMYNSGTFFDPI